MVKKNVFLSVITLALCSHVPASEETELKAIKYRVVNPYARTVSITLPEDATVADLLTSKTKERSGFNIPTIPQTTSRFFLRTAPMSMKSYNLYQIMTHGAQLTSAGVYRLLSNMHLLFFDKENGRISADGIDFQHAWEQALNEHKSWYSNKNPESLAALHAAEDVVVEYLKKLPLNDVKIRTAVENLLSTSTVDHGRLYQRTTTSKKGKEYNAEKAHPKGLMRVFAECSFKNIVNAATVAGVVSMLQVLARKPGAKINDEFFDLTTTWGLLNLTWNNMPWNNDKSFLVGAAGLVALLGFMARDIYDWKTDFDLVPEPNHGVNVVIKLQAIAKPQPQLVPEFSEQIVREQNRTQN